jgi:hypothetical protein
MDGLIVFIELDSCQVFAIKIRADIAPNGPGPHNAYAIATASFSCILVLVLRIGLKIEDLLKLLHSVIGIHDRVADCPGVLINLVVVTSDETLVAEEVDVLVIGAGKLLLGRNVLQGIGLVPAGREDIEGNLSANGETGMIRVGQDFVSMFTITANILPGTWDLRETIVGELLLESSHKVLANVVL